MPEINKKNLIIYILVVLVILSIANIMVLSQEFFIPIAQELEIVDVQSPPCTGSDCRDQKSDTLTFAGARYHWDRVTQSNDCSCEKNFEIRPGKIFDTFTYRFRYELTSDWGHSSSSARLTFSVYNHKYGNEETKLDVNLQSGIFEFNGTKDYQDDRGVIKIKFYKQLNAGTNDGVIGGIYIPSDGISLIGEEFDPCKDFYCKPHFCDGTIYNFNPICKVQDDSPYCQYEQQINETICPPNCDQIPTFAKNPETEECREFPTVCIPDGWEEVDSCEEKNYLVYLLNGGIILTAGLVGVFGRKKLNLIQ